MKKSIKIIIDILIILMLMLATKSYAALECKKNSLSEKMTTNQEKAFQLCYDMRDPTSSLGNNSLDPHLQLNKDVGAYAYLGMSAYGSNGAITQITSTHGSTSSNATGVLYTWGQSFTITAGTYDGAEIIKKYGKTKYIEVFNENYTKENTKGMSIIETKGWYNGNADGSVNNNAQVLVRTNLNNQGYGYSPAIESVLSQFYRPVIWNQ